MGGRRTPTGELTTRDPERALTILRGLLDRVERRVGLIGGAGPEILEERRAQEAANLRYVIESVEDLKRRAGQ